MVKDFIHNKVFYKFFDKKYTRSTHIYNKYKFSNEIKLAEISQNINAVCNEFLELLPSELNVGEEAFRGAQDKLIKGQLNKLPCVIVQQIHSDKIVLITKDNLECFYQADGLVTCDKNIILAIQTADCVPVLFSSDDGNVIGAAHCGWRGAKSSIIENIIKLMQQKQAKNIKAIIGPAIAQESYEVDSNFYQSFIEQSEYNRKFFIQSSNLSHYMFDLPGYVSDKLIKLGVEIIEHINDNTYSLEDQYPSYRRNCHQGKIYSQSILSTIMIK